MTYGLLVLCFSYSPELKWKRLRLLYDTQLSYTKADNTMVCDEYRGTAVPWYGCPDLARKHDPLDFYLRKYWGTLDENGMHMTWLASGSTQHETI